MNEYPVKSYTLYVLVPLDVEITAAFQVAVTRFTIDTAPGVPIGDAEARIEEHDDAFLRGYRAVVGWVRYIEPSEEDRPFAEQLKDKGITQSTIVFPRVS